MRIKDPEHLNHHQRTQKRHLVLNMLFYLPQFSPWRPNPKFCNLMWTQYFYLCSKVSLLMHGCPRLLLYIKLYIIHFTSVETFLQLTQVKPMSPQCEIITCMTNISLCLCLVLILRNWSPSSHSLIRWDAPTVFLVLC